MNMGGSVKVIFLWIKDRIGKRMVLDAEKNGTLKNKKKIV